MISIFSDQARVLVVRGDGGREWLADQLRARGADVRFVQAYVRAVRAKIQQCFGPWPEKTPLNPRVTGTVDRDIAASGGHRRSPALG